MSCRLTCRGLVGWLTEWSFQTDLPVTMLGVVEGMVVYDRFACSESRYGHFADLTVAGLGVVEGMVVSDRIT